MSEVTQACSEPLSSSAPSRSTRDTVFGVVGGAAVFLALLFALLGRADTGAEGPPPPPVTVLRPAAREIFSGPVTLEFRTPEELRPGAGGWLAGGRYHLHALVDGTERMPGPGDVQPLGGNRYRWVLPALPPGEHRVRLRWAGPDHVPLQAGGSSPFTVVTH
ncbi:MAG TPA: hypothetical protein VHG28_09820 [Longimicrobiaceae bacterium]|nr:hypothetical protein [Longimicrobiaceae bacterium]